MRSPERFQLPSPIQMEYRLWHTIEEVQELIIAPPVHASFHSDYVIHTRDCSRSHSSRDWLAFKNSSFRIVSYWRKSTCCQVDRERDWEICVCCGCFGHIYCVDTQFERRVGRDAGRMSCRMLQVSCWTLDSQTQSFGFGGVAARFWRGYDWVRDLSCLHLVVQSILKHSVWGAPSSMRGFQHASS